MDKKYLAETRILNYKDTEIVELVRRRGWEELDEFHKVKAVYEFVQNEILFGFNAGDTFTAAQVLADGIGQCNTKTTLLMALLRAVGMPCRLHGFEVTKDFQKGAATGIVAVLAPERIVHTWTEVYYQGKWLALEGVITDKRYVSALQTRYPDRRGEFRAFGVATVHFEDPGIDWRGEDTFIQKEAIVEDYGIFTSPDEFFTKYSQHFGVIKKFLYARIGSRMMTRNVVKIRER